MTEFTRIKEESHAAAASWAASDEAQRAAREWGATSPRHASDAAFWATNRLVWAAFAAAEKQGLDEAAEALAAEAYIKRVHASVLEASIRALHHPYGGDLLDAAASEAATTLVCLSPRAPHGGHRAAVSRRKRVEK